MIAPPSDTYFDLNLHTVVGIRDLLCPTGNRRVGVIENVEAINAGELHGEATRSSGPKPFECIFRQNG